MGALAKGLLILTGSIVGTILFLMCASMWIGSPIQDLAMSAHGRLIDHPTHKLTVEQVEALKVLIEHHAVMPAEKLIEQINDFYTTIINLLVTLIAALGIIAYMYIRSSTVEQVSDQTAKYFESDEFKEKVKLRVNSHVEDSLDEGLELAVGDIAERFEQFEAETNSIINKVNFIEKKVSQLDKEETEGLGAHIGEQNFEGDGHGNS